MGFGEIAEHEVVMFSGKGGVGKTTLSAATAVHLSSMGFRTLILTSDPAPSLGDVFGVSVGDRITEVSGNLDALELSPEAVLKRWKQKFGGEVYEVLSSLLPVDEGIVDYIGTAPGIDEEFTLDFIFGIVEEGGYERVVWDTAPAGHTLRLLRMPAVFIEHLTQAARVYMRFQDVMSRMRALTGGSRRSVFDIIDGWKELSKKLLEFLCSDRVGVVPVCTPQRMSIAQLYRMLGELQEFGIEVKRVVVNHVLQDACEHLRAVVEEQRACLSELEKMLAGKEVLIVPEMPCEVRGGERLRRLAKLMYG